MLLSIKSHNYHALISSYTFISLHRSLGIMNIVETLWLGLNRHLWHAFHQIFFTVVLYMLDTFLASIGVLRQYQTHSLSYIICLTFRIHFEIFLHFVLQEKINFPSVYIEHYCKYTGNTVYVECVMFYLCCFFTKSVSTTARWRFCRQQRIFLHMDRAPVTCHNVGTWMHKSALM